jgi:hypothetical protein
VGYALAAGSALAVALRLLTPAAPSPAPTEAPLHEIARVHATTPLCRALVTDAVNAVATETENDRRLADAIDAMNVLDFDANPLVKHRSTRALEEYYVALRAAAVSGIGTMKHYRDAAGTAPDEAQRASLTQFGDVLSGALYRQKVLADDVGHFIAYVDAHDSIDPDAHDRLTFDAILANNASNSGRPTVTTNAFGTPIFSQPQTVAGGDPLDAVPPTLTMLARDGASEIAKRARPIATDERNAATLIDPAFANC